MATTIRMPEVLANVTEAAVQKWLVAPGDAIAVGQPFAEIETEKAVVEYTAETAGTVLELLINEGDNVDVGAPIAIVGEAGEVAPASPTADSSAAEPSAAPVQADPAVGATPPPPALEQSTAAVRRDANPAARPFISPLVRRLAREHNLDLSAIVGSGPEGRIVRKDVEALLAGAPVAATPAASGAPAANAATTVGGAAALLEPELIPHSRMRTTIARRLTESKSTVPHFYLTADLRVDRLLELRREINAIDGVKISVNDLVVKAVAAAFVDVPEANTTWSDEGRLRHHTADIAIAVSLDDGLVTPVVRGVESLTVTALAAAITDLATRAREGRLKQHEIEGGSFAVSNLGMFGTQAFSAIINPPQAGILAVGAARQAPVVVDGALEVGSVMTVTLSADHRVMDGALAARWLAAFVARVENPVSILA